MGMERREVHRFLCFFMKQSVNFARIKKFYMLKKYFYIKNYPIAIWKNF